MAENSEARIHERLNQLVTDVGDIKRDVAVVAKGCLDCRPVVMGNGKSSLSTRLSVLEDRIHLGGIGLMAAVAIVSSVVSGLVVAAW